MESFTSVVKAVERQFRIVHRDKFVVAVELEPQPGRHQTVYLAEICDDDDRRYLRLETPVAPLGDHDPVKLLRVNLILRTGYLALGDLEGVPFIKLCANHAYRHLGEELLRDEIVRIARLGDEIETMLTGGGDWF
ncbi:MAG: hypothetical protein Kow0020_16010 [Wenzhouxiangellaceae bacterium]